MEDKIIELCCSGEIHKHTTFFDKIDAGFKFVGYFQLLDYINTYYRFSNLDSMVAYVDDLIKKLKKLGFKELQDPDDVLNDTYFIKQ